MMDLNASYIIEEYLTTHQDIFTADEFFRYLKSSGVKVTKDEVYTILDNSDLVFALVNEEFVTRNGVFLGRWFSFKPSKEEIQKKSIFLGHRCMPFINPEIAPDNITVISNTKVIQPASTTFSMNLALDVFALYGEGYVIPFIFNDHANTEVPLVSVQYGMPNEIKLTSWPLDKIAGGKDIAYGDRILCRVVNWEEAAVEMVVQPAESSVEISTADIEREEWYTDFENGLLDSFEKNGPGESIEQQLAYLFLENQSKLCIKNCGSAEEFLKHTKKIGFAPYGVESRIWKTGESVPYVGSWNRDFSTEGLFDSMSMIFSPNIIDAYLEDYIYQSSKKNRKAKAKSKEKEKVNPKEEKQDQMEEIMRSIFPPVLKMTPAERKIILLNIEKRHDILKKKYNQFSDYKMAPVRHRVIDLFSQVSNLICMIGCSGLKMDDFPQQELVILVQLASHIVRIIEEMENELLRDKFPIDDVSLSLEGMEETFEDIGGTLRNSLDVNTYKNIQIL